MPGWEGDLCAEGKGCAWMRGILGEAVCEGEHCKCSTESAIVVRKAKWGNGVRLDARNPWGGSMRGRLLHGRQRGSNVVRYEAQNP